MRSSGATYSSKPRGLLRRLYRPLLVSSLLTAGLFQIIPQVIAATAAGQSISNTATATYNDPDGNSLETTSNTVTITVAEVAGLTNVSQTPIDPNAGSVIPGDRVLFPFLITNTGNNVTDIYIPTSLANIPTQNLESTGALILIDTNNDGTPEAIIDPATQAIYAPGDSSVTNNGDGTYAVTAAPAGAAPAGFTADGGAGYTVDLVAAGASVTVTVQGNVSSVVSGSLVNVQLGDTPPNDANDPNSQNQDSSGDGATAGEVRTVDGADTDTGEVAGGPANNEREASDTSESLVVGTVAPNPLALATIRKTAESVANQGTPALTDDVITYGLTLEVENTLPLGITGYSPAPLEGTSVNVNGTNGTYILVSDAIPALTELDTASPIAPSANWTVVYTDTALTTTATAADWYTSRTDPAITGAITRVGFVYNTATNGALANGTTVTGFEFYVLASGAGPDDGSTAYGVSDIDGDSNTTEAAPIYNVAQVFGETQGDAGNNIVFDESGDQNPNNADDDGTAPANDNGTAGDEVYGDYNPAATTGNTGAVNTAAAVPDGDTDNGNNNSGTGTDGEANKLDLGTPPTPPAPGNLLTGPKNNTDAAGSIGQNDDFTNKSTTEAVTTGTTIANPGAVTFTNSVKNVSGVDLDNVVLRPISPTNANLVCTTCDYVEAALVGNADTGDLTDNTIVRIFVDNDDNGTPDDINGDTVANDEATYAWNGTDFVLVSGNLVQVPTLAVGTELDYKVIVTLADATPAHQGYAIPLVSYVNNDGNDVFNPTTELINNITIDRVYSGFLRLNKEARLLKTDGTTTAYSVGPITGAEPGDIIQYRITYTNVSTATPPSGQFNVALPATNVVIIENGLSLNPNTAGNNWALDNDNNALIDTQNVTGAATASQGTIQYYNGNPAALGIDQSGTTAASDVTEYRNSVGTVNPQGTGNFTFQREVQ